MRTFRAECLEHIIVMNERHMPVLRESIGYYNHERPHRTLGLQMPVPLEAPSNNRHDTIFSGPENPVVRRVTGSDDTVWLDGPATNTVNVAASGTGRFHGVPEAVWKFQIGGYQVCWKWLQERKGRILSHDDLDYYQGMVVAISSTLRIMMEIDEVIEEHGGWPEAFGSG